MKDTLRDDILKDLKDLPASEREAVAEQLLAFEKVLDKILGEDSVESILHIMEEIYADESRDT